MTEFGWGLIMIAATFGYFAFEEAEVGYGVGDSQAFGVVIGIEADGLEPVGDGDFCGFDALRQLS